MIQPKKELSNSPKCIKMEKAASREDEPPAPEGTQAETWKLPSWGVMEGNQVPGPSSPETLRAARPSQAYRHPQAHKAQHTHTPLAPVQTHRADPHHPTRTHNPLSSHLPTLVPCGRVLSPEATCSTLFEELRLEAPQATRDFGGGISFGPRAMAV